MILEGPHVFNTFSTVCVCQWLCIFLFKLSKRACKKSQRQKYSRFIWFMWSLWKWCFSLADNIQMYCRSPGSWKLCFRTTQFINSAGLLGVFYHWSQLHSSPWLVSTLFSEWRVSERVDDRAHLNGWETFEWRKKQFGSTELKLWC